MTCAECRDLIDAFADDELPDEDVALVRAHLAGCAECSRELAAITATSRRIGETFVKHQAPDVLKARIRSALAQPDALGREESPSVKPIAARRFAWAGLGIAVASSLVTFAVVRQATPQRSLTDDVVTSHIRALMPGHLTDVVSTNQHNVKPWFNGRVDLSPPVPNLDSIGFPLIGGRLDYLEGRSVPVVIYGRRQHLISVYSWPDSRGDASSPVESARNGYNVIAWRGGGLSLEAVSDLNRRELEDFVRAFQSIR